MRKTTSTVSRVTKAKTKQGAAFKVDGPGRVLRSASNATSAKHKTTPLSHPSKLSTTTISTSQPTIPSRMPPSDKMGPVYFWRPNDGNGYLGQWFLSPFTLDNETYATAEMWMMVSKARLFGDEDIAKEMLLTTDPKKHKSLGREVRGFDDKKWEEHRLRIVEEGNYYKFTVSEDAQGLRDLLMGTGERELVEASPLDRIWGVGFGEKNAEKNRNRWGTNLLGVALVNVRRKLKEEGFDVGKGCGARAC